MLLSGSADTNSTIVIVVTRHAVSWYDGRCLRDGRYDGAADQGAVQDYLPMIDEFLYARSLNPKLVQ